LFIRQDNPFGIISRVITDNKENIDLFITLGEDGLRYLMLVINESLYMMSEAIVYEQWLPVSIEFSSSRKEILLSYRNSVLPIPYPVSEINNIQMSFGLCLFPNYANYDVASVNIRDIRIFNDDKLIRYWKLEQYENNISYDSVARIPSFTQNAHWIIDDHSTWAKLYSKQLKHSTLFTFDETEGKLFMIPDDRRDCILIYDVKNNKESIVQARNGHAVSTNCSGLLYDHLRNQLVAYNLEEGTAYTFSFDNLTWRNNNRFVFSDSEYGACYNSKVYSAEDSSLFSFGGY
jgi:hypothetical protein